MYSNSSLTFLRLSLIDVVSTIIMYAAILLILCSSSTETLLSFSTLLLHASLIFFAHSSSIRSMMSSMLRFSQPLPSGHSCNSPFASFFWKNSTIDTGCSMIAAMTSPPAAVSLVSICRSSSRSLFASSICLPASVCAL